MIKFGTYLIIGLLLGFGSEAVARPAKSNGQAVLEAAFDPLRLFASELESGTDDELVFSAWSSARDDYAPAYSLAIAFWCRDRECRYIARMLRTGATRDECFEKSMKLFGLALKTKGAKEMKSHLDRASIQWLEADVNSCPNAIFSMDSVRLADWNPDQHYALKEKADQEIIMHPAAIRVVMHGTYTTSTYEGWVLSDGVPAAVQKLIETLEPCWKPGTSPHPWKRRG